MNNQFLPITLDDVKKRGWSGLDVVIVTGDAYVDHPSYGAAVIGRVLESNGFKVGIIAQPDWRSPRDFQKLGKPRLFFGVTSGNVDSMVAHYTANKRERDADEYSPGNKIGLRPDRALIVYSQRLRQAYHDVPIILGGIEASLRRLAHYDYWDNAVRRSVLADAKADMLVFGMGESAIVQIAQALDRGEPIADIDSVRGTVVIRKDISFFREHVQIPSYEEVKENKEAFNKAFRILYEEQNPVKARVIVQKHADRYVVHLPPSLPLGTEELDAIYELPYARNWHPVYRSQGGIKGFETVRSSLISHRGCCGECAFCSLYLHQGRIVQSRSLQSLVREARLLAQRKDFHGTITDIGGPTANLYEASCIQWKEQGFCKDKKCLVPQKCKNLRLGYTESLRMYEALRKVPGVKHVFIGSGFRYDLLTDKESESYLQELIRYYISGQMKVAPEYSDDTVLRLMNKPAAKNYEDFVRGFNAACVKVHKKMYLVNYFINAHPGTRLDDALGMALYLKSKGMSPEQVQDFIPLPMTLSACLYYTGKHPFTGERVYVPQSFVERKMQRAMMQYRNSRNRKLLRDALRKMNREHLFHKLIS